MSWLRPVVLGLPFALAAATVPALAVVWTDQAECSEPLTQPAQLLRETTVILGVLDAAAILALLVLLVRRRRQLRQMPPSRLTILWAAPIALLLAVGAFVPAVFGPFLLLGFVGLATFAAPLVAAVGYLLLVLGAVRLPRSDRDERRFVTGALVFYWLMLVVGLPTALVIPALQVTQFCLF